MNVKTIQIADKPTLDKINAMLKNSPDSIVGGGYSSITRTVISSKGSVKYTHNSNRFTCQYFDPVIITGCGKILFNESDGLFNSENPTWVTYKRKLLKDLEIDGILINSLVDGKDIELDENNPDKFYLPIYDGMILKFNNSIKFSAISPGSGLDFYVLLK